MDKVLLLSGVFCLIDILVKSLLNKKNSHNLRNLVKNMIVSFFSICFSNIIVLSIININNYMSIFEASRNFYLCLSLLDISLYMVIYYCADKKVNPGKEKDEHYIHLVVVEKVLGICMISIIFIELSIFNIPCYNNRFYDLKEKDILLRNIQTSETLDNKENKIKVTEKGRQLLIKNIGIESKSISIKIKGDEQYRIGKVHIKDDGNKESFVFAQDFTFVPKINNWLDISINSTGNLKDIKLDFTEGKGNFEIERIVINRNRSINLNFIRVILMFSIVAVIYLIRYFKIYEYNLEYEKRWQKIIYYLAMITCIIISIIVFLLTGVTKDIKYPLEGEVSKYPRYAEIFDSINRGQLELAYEVDERMIGNDDVYDTTVLRSENIDYLIDRVYYNGKYYSYFGLVPVITTYYPYYFIMGSLPSDGKVMLIYIILSIIFIFLNLRELIKMFCRKVNFLLYILGIVSVVFGSLLFMIETCANIYYIALAGAILYSLCFIYFGLLANRIKGIGRILSFILSGIFYVFAVGTRPNYAIIPLGFIVPVFISILLNRQITIKSKFTDVLSFSIPVIIGASLIMLYNYLRFGSITEFGINYQLLTSTGISNKSIKLHEIIPSIYHYLFQNIDLSANFPFVSLTKVNLGSYQNYKFIKVNMGLMVIPINWFLFLLGISFKTDRKILKKSIIISNLIIVLFTIVNNFAMVGSVIRYVCDLAWIFGFIAFIVAMEINGLIIEKKYEIIKKTMYRITASIFILTILLGSCLIFKNQSETIKNNNALLYYKIERIFSIW